VTSVEETWVFSAMIAPVLDGVVHRRPRDRCAGRRVQGAHDGAVEHRTIERHGDDEFRHEAFRHQEAAGGRGGDALGALLLIHVADQKGPLIARQAFHAVPKVVLEGGAAGRGLALAGLLVGRRRIARRAARIGAAGALLLLALALGKILLLLQASLERVGFLADLVDVGPDRVVLGLDLLGARLGGVVLDLFHLRAGLGRQLGLFLPQLLELLAHVVAP
jgi:hypothetical protein